MKMRKMVAAFCIVSVLLSACVKDRTSNTTCDYDPCALKAPASEITQLETYLSGAGITTAIKHCSGMYYEIITPGADKSPTACSYVSVNYKGTLTNGTVFDQTTTTPFVNILLSLIDGWQKGVPLIKKGGKIRLYIPPSLGYGPSDVKDPVTNAVVIPGNSILIFDIDLLDVQ